MDFRPCPRCCKLLPSEASFCRRCGVAVQARSARSTPTTTLPDPRLGSRWASTLGTAATAALGVVLALFAVSGPRAVVREGEVLEPAAPVPPRMSVEPGRRARTARAVIPPQAAPSPMVRRLPRDIGLPPFAARNPLRPVGPRVTSVGAISGRSGEVTIRGSGLGGCRQVMFVGTDRGRAAAKFVVWDDQHLVASVPDLGPWPQDAAVVVVGEDGVAVTVPASAPAVDSTVAITPRGTVCVVPPGAVFAGEDAAVVMVEGGGAARAARGATLFAREGGCIWGPSGGGDCVLYCEPGVLQRSDISACDVVEVDAVNPCVVPSLFHYAGR